MKKIFLISLLVGVLVFLVVFQVVWAAAVNPMGGVGARAKGMGGPGTAVGSGASIFYYNPALLGDNFFQIGTDYLKSSLSYRDPFGQNYDSDTDHYLIPLIGVGYKYNKKVSFGLGVVTPYMFGSDFSDLHLSSKLSLTNIVPAMSYRFSDKLSVGVALKIGFGKINLVQPVYAGSTNLGWVDSEADGWGYGWQIGILYKPADWVDLGISYQSKSKIDLDGKSVLTSSIIGNSSSSFSSALYFPGRLMIGIGLKLSDPLLVAGDVVLFDYSKTKEAIIDYQAWPDDKIKLDWKDNLFYGLGLEYKILDWLKLRTGVAYQGKVIPDNTVSPATPDMDGWLGSVGIGIKAKDNISIDLSYVHVLADKRDISLPNAGAGTYEADIDFLSMSVTYRF